MFASKKDYNDLIRSLLSKGANINATIKVFYLLKTNMVIFNFNNLHTIFLIYYHKDAYTSLTITDQNKSPLEIAEFFFYRGAKIDGKDEVFIIYFK